MQNRENSDQYKNARHAFDDLAWDQKALFIIEATFTTLARGLEEAGRSLGRMIDDTFTPPTEEKASSSEKKPPAKKPAAKKAAPRKTATARTRTPKTTSSKTPPESEGDS